MTPIGGHDELQKLLGAYALDALDFDEAEEVEGHLQICPGCRAEVAAHRDVATLFSEVGVEPPARVWGQILERMVMPPAGQGPLHRRQGVAASHQRRTVGMRSVAALVGLAAVVIVVLGLDVIRLERRTPTAGSTTGQAALQQAARAARLAPGARRTTLRSSDGLLSIDVVIVPDGTGYLVSNGLPALPKDQTYQLWGQTQGQLVSYGVLGSSPGVIPFRAETPPLIALAITAERAGGVPAPSKQPLLAGRLPPS